MSPVDMDKYYYIKPLGNRYLNKLKVFASTKKTSKDLETTVETAAYLDGIEIHPDFYPDILKMQNSQSNTQTEQLKILPLNDLTTFIQTYNLFMHSVRAINHIAANTSTYNSDKDTDDLEYITNNLKESVETTRAIIADARQEQSKAHMNSDTKYRGEFNLIDAIYMLLKYSTASNSVESLKDVPFNIGNITIKQRMKLLILKNKYIHWENNYLSSGILSASEFNITPKKLASLQKKLYRLERKTYSQIYSASAPIFSEVKIEDKPQAKDSSNSSNPLNLPVGYF